MNEKINLQLQCYIKWLHYIKYDIPYCRARFTPPSAKYLILDDFHFRMDPQIINYNGLSFHSSMGLPKLGWAVLPFRIYTLELINFVCFTFCTSPLKIFFFHSTPKISNIGVKRARRYGNEN
jgi:hypothetical protein